MKPFRIFLFVALTLSALALLAWCFPTNGISIGSLTIRFPGLCEVLFPKKEQYADISDIVQSFPTNETNIFSSDNSIVKLDSVTPLDKEIMMQKVEKIQYSPKHPHALDVFFAKLYKQQHKTEIIRILHYGDSQIEGDRVTRYLRTQLQNRFGGQGKGQIGLASTSPVGGMNVTRSKFWDVHSIIKPHHKKGIFYGTTMSFLKAPDTLILNDTHPFQVTINLNGNQPDKTILYCGSEGGNSSLQIYAGDSCIGTKYFSFPIVWERYSFFIPTNTKKLTIKASSKILLYSVSFQGNEGIIVDNIPLRGSAGWNFADNTKEDLAAMFHTQDVKLLIMQFGVNAVPEDPEEEIENFGFYQTALSKELRYLKSLDPELCILVIGISDRSRKVGNGYETNPNVLKIREAQRSAAFNTGCAYWDLFDAMGGENSMPSWVLHDPPLANSDFIHFNERGSQFIGELLYKSILQEYLDYIQRQEIAISQ